MYIVVVEIQVLRCSCLTFDPRFRLWDRDGDQLGILYRPFVAADLSSVLDRMGEMVVDPEDRNRHSVRGTCYFGKGVPVHHTVLEVVIFVLVLVPDHTTVEVEVVHPSVDVPRLGEVVLLLSSSMAYWMDTVPVYHRTDHDRNVAEAEHFDPNS